MQYANKIERECAQTIVHVHNKQLMCTQQAACGVMNIQELRQPTTLSETRTPAHSYKIPSALQASYAYASSFVRRQQKLQGSLCRGYTFRSLNLRSWKLYLFFLLVNDGGILERYRES